MPTDQHELIISLLRDNQALLQTNNELLQKQELREKRRFLFKIIWYTILLGVPMIAYYFLFNAFIGVWGGGQSTDIGGVSIPSGTLEELQKIYLGQ